MTNETQEELADIFEIIKEGAQNGNVIYETEDGIFSCPIDTFAAKSPLEILELLQVNIDQIFERVKIGDDNRFVNDMALANLLCYYRENWMPRK